MRITPQIRPDLQYQTQQQPVLTQPYPRRLYFGGNRLENIDPNNLAQIQSLPNEIKLQTIAMHVAPKTKNVAVYGYLAQRFKQQFGTVDYPVNPIHRHTLLHIAVSSGTPQFVALLLEAGADPTIQNAKGENSFDWEKRKISSQASPDDRQAIHQLLVNSLITKAQQRDKATTSEPKAQGSSASWLGWLTQRPQQAAESASSTNQVVLSQSVSTRTTSTQTMANGLLKKGADETATASRSIAQTPDPLLQKQRDDALRCARKWEVETQKIRKEHDQAGQTIAALQNELIAAQKRFSEEQHSATQTVKQLQKKVESLQKRLEQRTAEFNKTQERLQKELDAQQAKTQTLEKQHQQEQATLQRQLEEAKASQKPESGPKAAKLYHQIHQLQAELTQAYKRGKHLSEQLLLVQEEYRNWISRLWREKDSLNFQLAQTQWQRDESALILPKVHQVNEQLVANMNQQGRDLQNLRQTVGQQQEELAALQSELTQQAQQMQAQAELITQQAAQKQILSKAVAHTMALNAYHHGALQQQVQETYQFIRDLLAEKHATGANSPDFLETASDLQVIMGFQQQQLKKSSLLSTVLDWSPHPRTSDVQEHPGTAGSKPLLQRSRSLN